MTAVKALMGRIVGCGIGDLRGRPTVWLAIDGAHSRRSAQMRPAEARRVAQRLNDLAFHAEQLEREG